jgi:hypothetical protein
MSRTTFRSQVRGKAPIFSPRLFSFPRWKGLGVRFLAPEAPEAKSTTLKDLRSKDALSAPSIKANLQVRSGRLLAATRLMYPMEATRMRFIKRMAIFPAVIAACGLVAGCFSYHKTVDETATTPAPVVETVPAPVAGSSRAGGRNCSGDFEFDHYYDDRHISPSGRAAKDDDLHHYALLVQVSELAVSGASKVSRSCLFGDGRSRNRRRAVDGDGTQRSPETDLFLAVF